MAQYIITAIAAIIVALIEYFAAKDRRATKAQAEKMEERAKIRAEESRLSMRMMNANLELGLASCLAIEEHKFNGELKHAKLVASEAKDDYNKFLEKITSDHLSKL